MPRTDLVIPFGDRANALLVARKINELCGTDFEMLLIDLGDAEDRGVEVEAIPQPPGQLDTETAVRMFRHITGAG